MPVAAGSGDLRVLAWRLRIPKIKLHSELVNYYLETEYDAARLLSREDENAIQILKTFILPVLLVILSLQICIPLNHDTTTRIDAKTTHELIVQDQKLRFPRVKENGFLRSTGSLPDWSDVKRKSPYYIEVLLAVDAAVYTFQLDIRLTIVDVVPIHGYNITLEQFMDWKQTTEQLATHDLAILLRYRYEGGVAYVNGVCKQTAVGITGFYPEAPFEYASVFFHELSHLLGLSHTATADCYCPKKKYGTCLRIDGFDNECSAQALVDLLPSVGCLVKPLKLPPTVLALCGNGIVEGDEDCDCGPVRYCFNALCEPLTCRFILAKQYLHTVLAFGTALTICGIIILIKHTVSCSTGSKRRSSRKMSLSLLPHKPMLYCSNSSPFKLTSPHIDVKKFLTTSMISSSPITLPMAN
ncbi:hypothetical protein KIN20_005638 [Parelaphostrongylus tenuis]|nr:hypothetical protein KIN20_005638 [Parelaphostrongylus tenuis]